MQGAKSEQHNQAAVAGESQRLDKSKLRITINENDSRLERVVKAEQWCRQSLGVTEPDYIWYIRLGDTYFGYNEQEAANQHYQNVQRSLTLRRVDRYLTGNNRPQQFFELRPP